jgi:hypothetical protein
MNRGMRDEPDTTIHASIDTTTKDTDISTASDLRYQGNMTLISIK